MKKPNFKKHIYQVVTSYTYLFILYLPIFIYVSMFIFQFLRFVDLRYSLIFADFYKNVRFYELLPVLDVQAVYYYYTEIKLTSRMFSFMLGCLYYPIILIWLLFLKQLSFFCYLVEIYIISIDLLLDLTRFFIFHVDTDLVEFISKHPVFDSKTEFLVDKWFLNLMSYFNDTVPTFYSYLPKLLVKKYDYICSTIWRYFKYNYPFVALVYTAISFFYFLPLVMLHWVAWSLQDVALNYFFLVTPVAIIMTELLHWCYPWLDHYDFASAISIPVYMEFLHEHKHPRGVNLIIFFIVSNFIDKAFNTSILLTLFDVYLLNCFKLMKKLWIYLKNNKLMLFTILVIFFGLPGVCNWLKPTKAKPPVWHI